MPVLRNARLSKLASVHRNPGGSIFLCYGMVHHVTLDTDDGITPNGRESILGLPNLVASITMAGKPNLFFPNQMKEIPQPDGSLKKQKVDDYWPEGIGTRIAVTNAFFRLPEMKPYIANGLALRNAAPAAATREQLVIFGEPAAQVADDVAAVPDISDFECFDETEFAANG